MNREFKDWTSGLLSELQKPLQELMKFNLRALQTMHPLNRQEPFRWQKPDEWYDSQLRLAMEHHQRMLDYMRQTFQMMEHTWSSVPKDIEKTLQKQTKARKAKEIKITTSKKPRAKKVAAKEPTKGMKKAASPKNKTASVKAGSKAKPSKPKAAKHKPAKMTDVKTAPAFKASVTHTSSKPPMLDDKFNKDSMPM